MDSLNEHRQRLGELCGEGVNYWSMRHLSRKFQMFRKVTGELREVLEIACLEDQDNWGRGGISTNCELESFLSLYCETTGKLECVQEYVGSGGEVPRVYVLSVAAGMFLLYTSSMCSGTLNEEKYRKKMHFRPSTKLKGKTREKAGSWKTAQEELHKSRDHCGGQGCQLL